MAIEPQIFLVFLDNLKIVASSPYALVGYLALVAAWVYIVTENRRLTTVEKMLPELPKKDRIEILKKEYNTTPRAGLTAEQWIRSRKHRFLFLGFVAVLVMCTVLFLAAFAPLVPSGKAKKDGSRNINTNKLSADNSNATAIFQGVEANNISVNINNSRINTISRDSNRLAFELYVNGFANPIADHQIVALGKERSIRFRVKNVGNIAAENVSISVFFPLAGDEIASDGWEKQAPPVNPKTMQEVNGLLHLWSVWAGSISEQSWGRAPLLTISAKIPSPLFSRRALEELGFEFRGAAKNCPEDFLFHVLPVIVSVHSDHSKNQRFNVFFQY
jgi:hypothetical protein